MIEQRTITFEQYELNVLADGESYGSISMVDGLYVFIPQEKIDGFEYDILEPVVNKLKELNGT